MPDSNQIIYGVKKLIMINSATVEYIKLDLDLPLHLNAENNLGKTSTVNTLQFLYIDYVSDMFMPSSIQESVKFYFRDEYSYLIFECVSKTGTHCIVLNRSAGSLKHYNRYIIKGEYQRDIFIDSDLRPRSWDGVLEILAGNNTETVSVTHKEWWRSLSGLTDNKTRKKKIPSLFILPVKDFDSYKRFKMIYRHLLSMSSIKLETFKDILLSCAVASGEKRRIDFAEKEYKSNFEKCRKLQSQHQYYLDHEQEIFEIREKEKNLQKFRRNIPVRLALLQANYCVHKSKLEEDINTAEDRKKKIAVEKNEQSKKRDKFIGVKRDIIRDIKEVQAKISEYERLEKDDDLYLCRQDWSLENFKKHIEDIERDYYKLENDLKEIKEYTQEELESRVERIRTNMNDHRQIMDSDDCLFKWLQKEGIAEDDIHKLASLFNTKLITKPMDKVEVKDKNILLQKIASIADNFSTTCYEDSAVKIEIIQQQLHELTDREKLKKQIEGLEGELREAEKRLSLFLEQASKLKNLNKLENQRKINAILHKNYKRFEELKSLLSGLKAKETELKEKETELTESIMLCKEIYDGLDDELDDLGKSIYGMNTSLKTLNGDYSSLEETIRRHFPDAIRKEAKFNEEKIELSYLIDELPYFTSKIVELNGDSRDIELKKSNIMNAAGLTYDRESDWKSFLNANIDSAQAQERLNKEWQTFFGIAKHDFRSLVQCIDSINTLTKSIDRTFSRQKISNLSNIKVAIETKEFYQKAREFVLDSDDLFADQSKRRIYTGMFQSYFSKQYTDLRAEDMFNINIEISNLNNPSEKRNITSFENESEGTNYTIKALLLSQLLKEQFKYGLYQENIAFHYYLDEIGQLDAANLSNIVKQNLEKKLIPITAAPRPVIDPLCHPKCKVVTLTEDPETNYTYIAAENTFSAENVVQLKPNNQELEDNNEVQ
jgi:hypothetical protein